MTQLCVAQRSVRASVWDAFNGSLRQSFTSLHDQAAIVSLASGGRLAGSSEEGLVAERGSSALGGFELRRSVEQPVGCDSLASVAAAYLKGILCHPVGV